MRHKGATDAFELAGHSGVYASPTRQVIQYWGYLPKPPALGCFFASLHVVAPCDQATGVSVARRHRDDAAKDGPLSGFSLVCGRRSFRPGKRGERLVQRFRMGVGLLV
jgi:hypothetical protein